MNIAYLFGAGISIPAGLPSTQEITETILQGRHERLGNISRHSNMRYYFGEPMYAHAGIDDHITPRVTQFCNLIQNDLRKYYNSRYTVNYEDLFYIVKQLYDEITEEYDNPLSMYYLENICERIDEILQLSENEFHCELDQRLLISESVNYIHCICENLLYSEFEDLPYMEFLSESINDEIVDNVDIFTLNHDLLIEQYFQRNEVSYIDGFGQPLNQVRYWDGNLFESTSCDVNFFKLHGSINWYDFESENFGNRVGIPLNGDFWHTRDEEGELQHPMGGKSKILVGTFNKIFDYSYGIFEDLHHQFRIRISNTDRLIVCGYSFNDKLINYRIGKWLLGNENRRMIVIHNNVESIKFHARRYMQRVFNTVFETDRLIFIPKWIQYTSWDEMRSLLI